MYFRNLCRITFLLGVLIGTISSAMSVGGDPRSNLISGNTISDTSDKVAAAAISNSPVQTNEPQTPQKFTRYLKFNHKISVSWEVDLAKKKVYFHVVAKTLGWIGFGLSPSGSMQNADLIIGGVDFKGDFYFSDRSIKKRRSDSSIDAEQNWYLTSAYEGHGQTELKFWRYFDTGDEQDDLTISNMETNFIWAFGLTDFIIEHGMDRGSAKVNILTPPLSKFTRFKKLNDTFAVSWEVDNIQEKVTFKVIAKTLGWVGFGLSACGSMKNADLVIGGVGPKNTFYFADRYVGERNSMPTVDKQQDWHIISFYEGRGQTKLKFWRHFKTGDSADLDILNQETHFLWAIGETDEIKQHGADRGSDHVNILDPTPDSIIATTPIPTETVNRNFTLATLRQFIGQSEGQPIYVAVNSTVFDVSTGRTFYGPGRYYSNLAGRDASRALATGNTTNVSDGSDDLSDLDESERKSLETWYAFYVDKYPVIGRLV